MIQILDSSKKARFPAFAFVYFIFDENFFYIEKFVKS